jgi:hypothetical protein
MCFARACSANQNDVALGIEEFAVCEFANLPLVDGGLGEHKVVEVLEHGV